MGMPEKTLLGVGGAVLVGSGPKAWWNLSTNHRATCCAGVACHRSGWIGGGMDRRHGPWPGCKALVRCRTADDVGAAFASDDPEQRVCRRSPAVIRVAVEDRHRAVQLLGDDQAHQHVRERERAE